MLCCSLEAEPRERFEDSEIRCDRLEEEDLAPRTLVPELWLSER